MKLKDLLKVETSLVEDSIFFEMANLAPDETGLKYVIWIGEVGGQHGPRIKVSNVKGKFAKDDNFVLSIALEPDVLTPKSMGISNKDVADVKAWIKLNYELLMQIWKGLEAGTGVIALLGQLKKLGEPAAPEPKK